MGVQTGCAPCEAPNHATEAGSSGLFRGLCRRRNQQLVKPTEESDCPQDGGEAADKLQESPLLPTVEAAQFGPCFVSLADGYLWFAGSDDRQAEWYFAGSTSSRCGKHYLRCGQAWAAHPDDDRNEAGARHVEIKLQLSLPHRADNVASVEEGTRLSSPEAQAEAFDQAEKHLRAELEACLLTRQEGVRLEAGDQSVMDDLQVPLWEAIRAGLFDGSSTIKWSPVLGAFQFFLGIVSAIPGSQRLASVGEAMESRAREAFFGQGLGRECLSDL